MSGNMTAARRQGDRPPGRRRGAGALSPEHAAGGAALVRSGDDGRAGAGRGGAPRFHRGRRADRHREHLHGDAAEARPRRYRRHVWGAARRGARRSRDRPRQERAGGQDRRLPAAAGRQLPTGPDPGRRPVPRGLPQDRRSAGGARVDLFLCETMLSAAEARAATVAARESGKPVWTALSVNDADGTLLRSGEGVAEGAQAAVAAGADAVLINCSSPEAVATAMPLLAGVGVPFGGYANGFVSIGALQAGRHRRRAEGARRPGPGSLCGPRHGLGRLGRYAIVGGCCEIGPGAHRRAPAAARGGRPRGRGCAVARPSPRSTCRRPRRSSGRWSSGPASEAR